MIKHAVHVALAFCLAAAAVISDSLATENIVRPYQSVRSAGMGNVRLTTGLYDENFFGNPARAAANPKWKVSLVDVMAEVNTTSLDTVGDLTGGGDVLGKISKTAGKNNHARIQTAMPSFYFPRMFGSKNSLAIGVLTSTQADVDLRKAFLVEPKVLTDLGPNVTFARQFMEDKLAVGITAHATYRLATKEGYSFVDLIKGNSISPSQSGGDGSHIDGDVGATYLMPFHPLAIDFTSGLAMNNILGGKYSNLGLKVLKAGVRPPAQRRSVGFGMAARRPSLWVFSDPVVAIEVTDIGNNANGSMWRTVHMGGELRFGILAPRLGINQGYFAAGLGINLKLLEIDLATYGEEMSLNVGGNQDRRYAVRVAIQI